LTEGGMDLLGSRLPWALLVSGAMAAAAYRLRTVRRAGAVAGAVLGASVYTFAGVRPFLLLGFFFVLGSLVTKWGWEVKERRGLAEGHGGARGWPHIVANGTPIAALAVCAFATGNPPLLSLGIAAALAAALGDTASSEIGQVHGSRPVSLPAFKTVPVGTPGAVSYQGSLAGLAAAAIMALLAVALGLVALRAAPVIAVAAAIAGTIESILGFELEGAGHHLLNAVNASLGAGLAMAGWAMFF
jgi:uncharacterized protein (TIGR00297 family)